MPKAKGVETALDDMQNLPFEEALNDAAFKIRWKSACVILPFEEREALRANRLGGRAG